jgi:hypothetical protein
MGWPSYRTFDGKRYKFSYPATTKKDAQRVQKMLKDNGLLARIDEQYDPGSGRWYIVYYRKKEK